ncbi:ribosome-associated translation inhibitor RaiA [Ornithinimicrobium sp. F0845]|uniref:ribosome hibernation-promoting factor, HPF/YfiA family n=1 Tax=Ornithinimicrobium sp. F0845 TaxID=2926412 RepID=UPI001FF56F98|nr:ribosome-associated translation inhibitor RaiA [Ornithinimicrobium sp. F0845]MCK0111396.1 ribosome-associated translation inhibitor RaiA [Ornithinimicrobium sp. F0845]
MEITVTGRKKTVSDRFRRHLEEKLDKIPQLAPRVSRTDVVLTHESNPRQSKESERVEITCYIKRTVVRAEACADEDYAALDLAMTRLLERLRRSNDRRRISHTGKHRKPSVAEATFGLPTDPLPTSLPSEDSVNGVPDDPEEAVAQALGTEGNSPIELREKVHASEPMSTGQALNEMELVGHDFYLFHDADTDQPSVVYRRRGWSYGVLRLAPSTDTEQEPAEAQTAAVG